jgi:hypothetical protein
MGPGSSSIGLAICGPNAETAAAALSDVTQYLAEGREPVSCPLGAGAGSAWL